MPHPSPATVAAIPITEPVILAPIELVSHPSSIWPAPCRHLVMGETGLLLAVSADDPLRAAAQRLVQQGYSRDATILIRDAHALAPDITGTIRDALA
jgi:hypothetical protein